MAKPDRMTPDEIKTKLEGPVMSIPTSFLADGAIDYDGVANVIETGIDDRQANMAEFATRTLRYLRDALQEAVA